MKKYIGIILSAMLLASCAEVPEEVKRENEVLNNASIAESLVSVSDSGDSSGGEAAPLPESQRKTLDEIRTCLDSDIADNKTNISAKRVFVSEAAEMPVYSVKRHFGTVDVFKDITKELLGSLDESKLGHHDDGHSYFEWSETLTLHYNNECEGGWYYPNAVMPWRGLLESEAYAHSTLCDLLSHTDRSDIADGIRLWLMLQKETQKWDEDPAFVDALTSILDGSEDVLATKVLILKAEYTKPFESIVAAGNGFTIERKFFREVTVEEKYNDKTEDKNRNVTELQEIKPGEQLHVGDKILMKYCIWNQENRSFVRLTAPREASLRPVDQLSGHYGWRFNPLRISRFYTLSPQGYRNVKAEKTEYYFDSYPEEKTEITEEFFVTEAGTFKAPVVSIESLYAPHYRANDGFKAVLDVAP